MTALGTRLFTFFRGRQVGLDEFGNRYFIERRAVKGRRARRWVIYKGVAEPSKVPPHWHGWLHYTTDKFPKISEPTKRYDWQKDHLPNLTGTKARYLPKGHVMRGAKRQKTAADYTAWTPDA
jgi:NADH:ubiquinone oxidoreductase subunit